MLRTHLRSALFGRLRFATTRHETRHFHTPLALRRKPKSPPPPSAPIREPQPKPNAQTTYFQLFSLTITYVAGFLITAHVFTEYCYEVGPAWGISMLPTISSFGEWLVISKWYRRGRGVEVGDIVSYSHPVNQGSVAVKRVMGMPGDFVLQDTPHHGEGRMLQVPQGHCWIVGDDLPYSRDSRHFGPLPLALVRGKVVAKVGGSPLESNFKRIDDSLGVD